MAELNALAAEKDAAGENTLQEESTTVEAEAAAPKKRRGRKAAAAKEEAGENTAVTESVKKVTRRRRTVKAEAEEEKEAAPKKTLRTRKAAAKKAPAAEPVCEMHVQYYGMDISQTELVEAVKKAYAAREDSTEEIKTIEIYVKPEENAAYYVINGTALPDYKLEL